MPKTLAAAAALAAFAIHASASAGRSWVKAEAWPASCSKAAVRWSAGSSLNGTSRLNP